MRYFFLIHRSSPSKYSLRFTLLNLAETIERTNSVEQPNTSCVHIKLTFLFNVRSSWVIILFKQAKCQQPHKGYFALKRTSFSDAFIAKIIRLDNTVVLHRSPPEDLNQENWSSTHFYWFKSPTWSRKSLSGEAWKPVQAPNIPSNHGTIVEKMSVFKGFKLFSLSELIVPDSDAVEE